MTKKEELEIQKNQLEIDLLDVCDEFDDLVNIYNGNTPSHCKYSTIANCLRLMRVASDGPFINCKLPQVDLDGCSKDVVNTYTKIKKLRSQFNKVNKKLDNLKSIAPRKVTKQVIFKPKGTVVEKQETRMRNTSDGHYKFWNIKQLDSLVITEWGAIGTVGESLVKKFDTVDEATTYFFKKEQEKFKKGYYRV